MVTKDQILSILETFIHSENSDYETTAYTHGLNDAAEAVVKFVERQPVDRVQAMATLIAAITDAGRPAYIVPGVGETYIVIAEKKRSMRCYNMETSKQCLGGCIHIKAVKLYQEQDK